MTTGYASRIPGFRSFRLILKELKKSSHDYRAACDAVCQTASVEEKETHNMRKGLFAVIVFQSFDADTPTYLFDDEIKANEYAKTLWLDAYKTEESESAHGVDHERSYWDDEMGEGEIYWNWDDEDYIRFCVTEITDKRN